jgi:hypothetical protein
MFKNLIIGIFCSLSVLVSAQNLTSFEAELSYHADVMANASKSQHRIAAGKKFGELMTKALEAQNSFDFPFDSLPWVSRLYAEDKSFRIITWETSATTGNTYYNGYIQMADGKLISLIDNFKTAESIDEEVSPDAWYGAIYYNIMDVKQADGSKYYLLFGINKWSNLEHKKLIDVLFFSKEGQPYFGKKVFREDESGEVSTTYQRLVFTYASDSRMTINYNPGLGMIVHDNLIPKLSRIDEQSRTLVPDGSYVGWAFDNQKNWIKVDKLATQAMETAPRPTPVLDDRKGKSVFGAQKKSKNQKQ